MRRSLLVLSLSLGACLGSERRPRSRPAPVAGTILGRPAASALNGHVTALNAVREACSTSAGTSPTPGGIAAADRIAKWDGTKWQRPRDTPLGNGSVFAIETYGGKVYAGGTFVNAGGKAAADYLAVFDGVSWKPFCNATANPPSTQRSPGPALQVIGSTLYVGGTFQNANGDPRADYLIACDLATGRRASTVDTDGDFTERSTPWRPTSDGTLYAGGTFTNLDRVATADGVAAYDGAPGRGSARRRSAGSSAASTPRARTSTSALTASTSAASPRPTTS